MTFFAQTLYYELWALPLSYGIPMLLYKYPFPASNNMADNGKILLPCFNFVYFPDIYWFIKCIFNLKHNMWLWGKCSWWYICNSTLMISERASQFVCFGFTWSELYRGGHIMNLSQYERWLREINDYVIIPTILF